MIRHLINLLLYALPPSRMFPLRRLLLKLAGIELGDGVCFCGRSWIYGRGKLSIGVDSWISPGALIHTHLEAPIVIGSRCDLGPGVEIIPGGHQIGSRERRAGAGTAKPISINDGCWIGARVIVLGGVNIGAGSVVAAGAVVTRDVDENVLVAGVPARVKRQILSH